MNTPQIFQVDTERGFRRPRKVAEQDFAASSSDMPRMHGLSPQPVSVHDMDVPAHVEPSSLIIDSESTVYE